MNIDWINALVGGLMIGTASGVLMLGNGRIAGISDIVGNLVERQKPSDWMERVLFIAGLLAAPLGYFFFKGTPDISVTSSLPILIIGGFLVGIGSRMGSGCTSGHGVCGNARLSKRSIVATITFMATAIITVAIMNSIS